MPKADELTEGSAQRAIGELEPVVDKLSGNAKGNAYYILGAAYFKKNNSEDGCSMWTKARPLVTGNTAKMISDLFDTLCK
jgi:hypothetical protein